VEPSPDHATRHVGFSTQKAVTRSTLHVTEIFHSIQGESSWVGRPCVFVRLTGCPLRCHWCDTEYAFSGGTKMAVAEILDRVRAFGCPLVEVTGGEPLAQPGCRELLRRLAEEGFETLLETSGALTLEDIHPRVRIIMDLKCPDSGECERNRWENLRLLRPGDEVKFVLASEADYAWAREVVRSRRLTERGVVLFSPVAGRLDPAELARWVLRDRLAVTLQVQLHKILFGEETRGV